MDPIKIVVRFLDGRVMKGHSQDFNPTRIMFHLQEEAAKPADRKTLQIEIKDLKAVFFVKTYAGNKDFHERKEFAMADRAQGRKVEVTFTDGETMQGSTVGYDPQRPGFFLLPIDPGSNNMRIFVVSAAVKTFRFL